MPKPEIIGSVRSTYTRAVCMVCEEKGTEYACRTNDLPPGGQGWPRGFDRHEPEG
jgi:hypothetical protein